MRIIHVEDYFDPTAGYQINELLNASKEFTDEVFLITSNDMSPFHKKVSLDDDSEFEQKTGVKIIRLEARFKISSRIILKNLKKKIIEINPDVVFLHGIGDFKDLQLWGKKTKYKIIRDCHMSWVASKNKLRHIYYFAYKLFFASIINRTNKYERIYALGDEEYEYLKRIGISDHKIDFLRHGYNESIMHFDETERNLIRGQYNFTKDDIVISYIGKFNYSKRPDIVLDIINMFDNEFIARNKLKLLFIGPKDDRYMTDFNYKKENIKNKIHIYMDNSKPFNELKKYFSASDICIFPKETTLSSIHAQVCGCSVIMESHKSNIERVVNKGNLYQPDNLTQAFEILNNVITNREFNKDKRVMAILREREYKNQMKKLSIEMRNIIEDKD